MLIFLMMSLGLDTWNTRHRYDDEAWIKYLEHKLQV
jgi:hypothetical protein